MTRHIRAALIGQAFMGKAHSNAYRQVGRFFDLPVELELSLTAGLPADDPEGFAAHQGWERATARWRDVAKDDSIDLVDIATPNHVHREMATELLAAGKHVACEKPLAGTLEDARAMRDAAKKAKGKTFVWFNYRRCPAVALARQLVREKRLGEIYHVRAQYLQSWGGPETPLLWRFQKKHAGSGAHGDLNAHIVDLARFITGEEVTDVHGGIERTFIKKRKKPGTNKYGRSDVDDCVLFLATFSGGAAASFEASRVAHGHLNANRIEINGAKGSLRFEFEDMNTLQYCDATSGAREYGWKRIMATNMGEHPYVDAWWPDGHVIGYEHTFTNQLADMLRVLGRRKPLQPIADFEDAYQTQRVLEAAVLSARERRAVKLSEVR